MSGNRRSGMPMPSPAPQQSQVSEEAAQAASGFADPVASGAASQDVIQVMPRNIEVRALRFGFYKNIRREVDKTFTVDSMSELGSWMHCIDPAIERQHQVQMKLKKDKQPAGK